MFIDIKGTSVKTPRFLVKKAAKFYGEYLMGKKLAENVNLTIDFEKFEPSCKEYAYCDWVDDNHRSRVFVITINRNLSKKETLLALAHEMVHVKQYAKGELKDIFRPVKMTKWMGESFPENSVDYWDSPWEWEAFGREKGLYIKFLAHLKENDTI
jgi:hypothetical protein